MAINYTQAFNAGEVSRKMDGRSDLEIYKAGCRDLDNFFVLPQGGLLRRAGFEYIAGVSATESETGFSSFARLLRFSLQAPIKKE